jgi:hypothetical protein
MVDGTPGVQGHRRTSTLAILGLILSVIGLAPFGLALSIMGYLETRDRDVDGRAIAVAGIVIGGVGTLIITTGIILWRLSRG